MNPKPGLEPMPGPHNNTLPHDRLLLILIALCLCWIVPAAGQAPGLAAADAAQQVAAIERARAGQYPEALAELARLRLSYPESTPLLLDEIVVLSWAEHDDAVLARAATIDSATVPVHVQVAIGKSMRNLRRFDDAIRWYAEAVSAEPSHVEARIGLTFAYAEAGRFELADQTLDPLRNDAGSRIIAELATAYVHERAGRWLQALSSYDQVLVQEAGQRDALRGKALVLRRLLLPGQALAIATAHPGILTEAELGRLRADEIALQVRYGTQVGYPAPQQYAMTDRAIASLEAYLAAGVADSQTELALRSDRIIALAERRASAEAVVAYELLVTEYPDLPAPVLAAAGKAYLDTREPERALDVLQRAVALEPGNLDLSFALFYAYAEVHDNDAALALAERLAADLPLTLGPPGSAAARPNPDRLRAEMLVGIALAYADRLGEAQAHLEPLLAQAPNNADLRHELANIYRWRGWLDRSLFEYRQVLAVEPELLEARVGKAHAELDRNEFEIVATDVDELNREHAEEPAVERLTSLWTVRNSSELRFDATSQDSSGVTFGSSQYSWAFTWLSAPIDYRYRAFASSRDAFAEFPEGDSRRQRLAAGLQYEYARWLASAELSADRDGGGELGARGSVDYRLNDFWVLSSAVELESDAVPLRGHRLGLDSNLVSAGARYAPDERLTLELGIALEDLSDGNARTQLSAQGRRRLVNESKFAVELIGEAFVGNRRRDDVPYFSPLRDVGFMIGAETQWRALRRYERRLTHILRGEIGSYDQSGFPRGDIWRVAYMMPFELSPTFSTWLGIWRNRMFYDGAPEYSTTASVSLQVRF